MPHTDERRRRAEKDAADAWWAIHNETTDTAKAFHAQAARHQEQLRAVEQIGYDRGIADAKAHPETLGLRSALVKAPAPAVPDGWKLVPVEPTEAMKVAAFGPIIEGGRGGPITKDFLRQEIGIRTFKAMIAAAPSFGTDYPGGALSTEQSTLHPLADRGKSATTSQPLVRGEGE